MRNREKWNDKDWEKHLGIPENEVPKLRKFIEQNYSIKVVKFEKSELDGAQTYEDGKWRVVIYKRQGTPPGSSQFMSVLIDDCGFKCSEYAVKYGNKYLMPTLKFAGFFAARNKIPINALQLLRIKTK